MKDEELGTVFSNDSIEEKLARLTEELADARIRISKLEGRGFSNRILIKLKPQLFEHIQYSPRSLHVPLRYLETKYPEPAPSIAIVTPSFNQCKFIGQTIESVLSQNYPALHYHVQDGGSTDGTLNILANRGGRFSYNSGPDGGQAHAINKGFSRISGEIMGYLNSDDMLLPGSLAYVATFFAQNPNVDFVYGHRIFVDADSKEVGRWVLPPHDGKLLKWADFVPQETMFWRRSVWERLGQFNENYRFALDWEFLLRAQATGIKFVRLPRFIGCFRVHKAQKTVTMREVAEAESALLRLNYLGREVSAKEIDAAVRPYLRRHVLYHRLYKFPLVKY